jgi:hypothetical protein
MVSVQEVVQDLVERTDIAYSTKSTTRAALIWYLSSGEVKITEETQEALVILKDFRMSAPQENRVSTPRPKRIPEADLAEIRHELYGRAGRSK